MTFPQVSKFLDETVCVLLMLSYDIIIFSLFFFLFCFFINSVGDCSFSFIHNLILMKFHPCRYLQWLIEDQDSDDTRFHTLYALSLAKSALETVELELAYRNADAKRPTETNASDVESETLCSNPIRERLQLFLQSSDLYDPEEVLYVIEGSELWLEKVQLAFLTSSFLLYCVY